MKQKPFGTITHYFPRGATREQQQAEAEIERLYDLVASLTEDLRIALGIIEQQGGQVPRVWLQVLRQNVEQAEKEVAAFSQDTVSSEEDQPEATTISLRTKRQKRG